MTPKWLRKSKARDAALLAATKVVKVGTDDMLVIEFAQDISLAQAERVKTVIGSYLKNPCLVLGGGAKFSILAQ